MSRPAYGTPEYEEECRINRNCHGVTSWGKERLAQIICMDDRNARISAFQDMANLATKAGVEGNGFRIQAPLQNLSKAQIVQAGVKLGVDYGLTVSCYQADDDGRACGKCDSCRLRAEGFAAAGVSDPTPYF